MGNGPWYFHPAQNIPLDSVENLHKAAKEHWEEGKKILRHYERLEQGYSDWEDRLIAIENAIAKLEAETGLDIREEVLAKPEKEAKEPQEFDIDDFLNG